MNKVYGDTASECLETVKTMRRYKPFEYSGGFLVFADGQGYYYATYRGAVNRINKAKEVECFKL